MTRNRLKRLLREWFRFHQHSTPACDVVDQRPLRGQGCGDLRYWRAVSMPTGTSCASDANVPDPPHRRLPLAVEPMARQQLPVLSELLVLRARGDCASRRAAVARGSRAGESAGVIRGIPAATIPCPRPAIHRLQATHSWITPVSHLWIALRAARVAESRAVEPRFRSSGWRRDHGYQWLPTPSGVQRRHPRTAACRHCQPRRATSPAATAGTTASAPAPALPGSGQPVDQAPRVHVVTDVLDVDLSLQGGDMVRADLLRYPTDKQAGSPPVRLLELEAGDYSVIRSGLRAAGGRAEPTHLVALPVRGGGVSAGAGRAGAASAADLDGWPGTHGHQDLHIPTGQLRHRARLRSQQSKRQRVEGRFVRAVRASRSTRASARSSTSRPMPIAAPRSTTARRIASSTSRTRTTRRLQQTFAGGWMAAMQHHFVAAAVPPIGDTVRLHAEPSKVTTR